MTTEEKAKAYDNIVQRVTELYETKTVLTTEQMEYLFPELRESENERIRKDIIKCVKEQIRQGNYLNINGNKALAYLENQKELTPADGWDYADKRMSHPLYLEGFEAGISVERELSEFEKQKYDRMKPIYDARESFESALEKAWNDYHNGYENVDKLEDDYVECAHAKGFREGYLFGIEKQKEHQNNSDAPNESSWAGMISSSDKDKNLDEIAQDYVDGVKEYNPEPTWDLMQTAVCYGYHYREQEEQKPAEIDFEDRDTLDYIRNILRKRVRKDEEFNVLDKWLTEHYIEQKPAELSEEDEKMVRFYEDDYDNNLGNMPMCDVIENRIKFKDWLLNRLKSIRPQPKQEWSEEDEKFFITALWHISYSVSNGKSTDCRCDTTEWLKSIKERIRTICPSWKPSEEQMDALHTYIYNPQYSDTTPLPGSDMRVIDIVKQFYEQLLKNL